jgi:3-dehydroquinate dehydratase/shikimate dehydrogenase
MLPQIKIPICAVVVANNNDEAIKQILKAEKLGADIIEVRFDYFTEDPNFRMLKNSSSILKIATNRRKNDGGVFNGDEEERLNSLRKAAAFGFEYVDLELNIPKVEVIAREIRELGSKIIISLHMFDGTPQASELTRILKAEANAGGDVCKLVTMAKDWNDNLEILSAIREFKKEGRSVIGFAMGKYGIISRIFSPLFGGLLTYASIEKGYESAPGQLNFQTLLTIYNHLNLLNK